jgi:hypothetical protein
LAIVALAQNANEIVNRIQPGALIEEARAEGVYRATPATPEAVADLRDRLGLRWRIAVRVYGDPKTQG